MFTGKLSYTCTIRPISKYVVSFHMGLQSSRVTRSSADLMIKFLCSCKRLNGWMHLYMHVSSCVSIVVSTGHVQKLSVRDDWNLEPPEVSRAKSIMRDSRYFAPRQKLNTFSYARVNFACNFTSSEYAKKVSRPTTVTLYLCRWDASRHASEPAHGIGLQYNFSRSSLLL